MHTAAFFALSFGNLLGVLVASRSRGDRLYGVRAVMALALGSMSVAAPLCLSRDWPIFRTVIAFGFAAGFLRVIQVVREPAGTTLGGRALSVITLVIDPRRLVRTPRELRLDAFATGVVETGLAVALFLAPYAPAPSIRGVFTPAGMLRTLVGAVAAYLIVEGVARLIEGVSALIGVDAGPLHDAPIRARTVSEFWSRRWNRAVHSWLSEHTFRPTAIRFGGAMGVMAAFGASALLHLVPIWIAYDHRYAIAMGAFFLLHGGIVIVEAKLGVRRWPRALGHMWTLGVFAVTLPLFVEPMLVSLGR